MTFSDLERKQEMERLEFIRSAVSGWISLRGICGAAHWNSRDNLKEHDGTNGSGETFWGFEVKNGRVDVPLLNSRTSDE